MKFMIRALSKRRAIKEKIFPLSHARLQQLFQTGSRGLIKKFLFADDKKIR